MCLHVHLVFRALPAQNMETKIIQCSWNRRNDLGDLSFPCWEPPEAGDIRNLSAFNSGCLILCAYWGGRRVYLSPRSRASCQQNAKQLFQWRWLIRRDGTDVTSLVKVNVFLDLKISEKYKCKWKIMTRPTRRPRVIASTITNACQASSILPGADNDKKIIEDITPVLFNISNDKVAKVM